MMRASTSSLGTSRPAISSSLATPSKDGAANTEISDLLASLANQRSRRRQGSSVRHPGHVCTLFSGTAGPGAIWLTEPVLCAGASALSALRIVARSTSSWDRAPTTAGM